MDPSEPGAGGGSPQTGGSTGQGPVVSPAVEHVSSILTSASGSVDATAGGTELFVSPHMDRRRVTITNTHATETNYLYVLVGGATISATVYRNRISGAGSAPVSIDIGPGVVVKVFGVAGGTTYLATEESFARG